MEFWKMQGAGNDFIIADNREGQIGKAPKMKTEMALKVCDRHFGVGADGFMCVEKSNLGAIKMSYYNADGSEATMCGNGLRCFTKFVYDQCIVEEKAFTVETGDGLKQVEIKAMEADRSIITIDMGSWDEKVYRLDIKASDQCFEAYYVHLGVPHVVIFLDQQQNKSGLNNETLSDYVSEYGPLIEKDSQFPEGVNVNFVETIDYTHVRASTWERGAGATLACGTGACASAVMANRIKNLAQEIMVEMPGGGLRITITPANEIFLEGPAQLICKGSFL